ncbi:MAG: hypothetical protein ACR2NU_03155 [Aeoliella sp.]
MTTRRTDGGLTPRRQSAGGEIRPEGGQAKLVSYLMRASSLAQITLVRTDRPPPYRLHSEAKRRNLRESRVL